MEQQSLLTRLDALDILLANSKRTFKQCFRQPLPPPPPPPMISISRYPKTCVQALQEILHGVEDTDDDDGNKEKPTPPPSHQSAKAKTSASPPTLSSPAEQAVSPPTELPTSGLTPTPLPPSPTYMPGTYMTMDDLFTRYAPLQSVQSARPIRPTVLPTLSIHDLYAKFHKPTPPRTLASTTAQAMPKTPIPKRPSAMRKVSNAKTSAIDSFSLSSFAETAKILLVRVPTNINIPHALIS